MLSGIWSWFCSLLWWTEVLLVLGVILFIACAWAAMAEWRHLGKRDAPLSLPKRLRKALEEFLAPLALVAGVTILLVDGFLKILAKLERR